MEEITPESLETQYRNLMVQVGRIRQCLQLLTYDHALKKTYNITYAVDFHEIWNYAEPFAQFSYITRRKLKSREDDSDEVREIFQIKQFARAELFYLSRAANSCVLLPPYVNELNNKITYIQKKILSQESNTREDSLRKLIKLVGAEKSVLAAMKEYQERGQISPTLLDPVQDLLEKKVRELLFLVSEVASDGVNLIQELFSGDNPGIQMSSVKWPDLHSVIQQKMQEGVSEWFTRFNKVRSNSASSASNYYDSKAIDLVLALNEILIKKGEVVVIVSDAPTMERVLKKDYSDITKQARDYIWTEEYGTCIQISGHDIPVPIFRPIEMFYYNTILKSDSEVGFLEKIKVEMNRIDQLAILGESIKKIISPCDKCITVGNIAKCSLGDGCRNKELQTQIAEHKSYFDKYTKVLLAENRFPTLTPAWEKLSAQQNEFQKKLGNGVFALIKYLSSQQEPLEKSFKVNEQVLQEKMEAEQQRALTMITDLTSSMPQDDVSVILKRITRTRYRIHFEDTEVAGLLNALEEARDDVSNARKTSQIIKKLINRAYDKNLGLEKPLLWAILLLSHRLMNHTINLVDRVLPDISKNYMPEYLYVKALASYLKKDFDMTINECKKHITQNNNDARFYHLLGLAVSKRLPQEPKGIIYTWDDAIKFSQKAREINDKKDKNLHSAITNNLAYFLSCRNKKGDLRLAFQYVGELKQLVSSDELNKMPEFLNTIGWVLKETALQEINKTTQMKYASEALDYLDQAYKVAAITMVEQSEIDEYKEDLYNAKQQLKNIVPLIDKQS